jgi:hypothetical protein
MHSALWRSVYSSCFGRLCSGSRTGSSPQYTSSVRFRTTTAVSTAAAAAVIGWQRLLSRALLDELVRSDYQYARRRNCYHSVNDSNSGKNKRTGGISHNNKR